jgi:hypothetical protein
MTASSTIRTDGAACRCHNYEPSSRSGLIRHYAAKETTTGRNILWQQQSGAMQLYSAQDNHTINNYVLRKRKKKRGKKICCP